MCGIAGIWNARAVPREELSHDVSLMMDRIVHRGPDSGGSWVHDGASLALGHRRLAIVDLSPGGHQPMVSASGRFVITLNGEIYNFLQVKARLASEGKLPALRGTSDTEIVLAAIEAWGLERAIKSFNGMFAFGLWDNHTKTLTLVRDRVGKKPLYFGNIGDGSLVFASELKAFFPLPNFERRISRNALELYLELGYVPAPLSIFNGIMKLDAGNFVTFDGPSIPPRMTRYWSLTKAVADGENDRCHNATTIEELESLIEDATRIRMLADVPLGALLSGGIDSSLVVAMMQRVSSTPVRTFSIGFAEANYNEAAYAAEVAHHLGTRHEELYVTPADCLAAVPLMARIYDEPFSDSSQIPTYLVSKLARGHVTVCLSGDGGDEFFAGYNRYKLNGTLLTGIRKTPLGFRRTFAAGLGLLSPDAWTSLYEQIQPILPGLMGNRVAQAGDKIHKIQTFLAGRDDLDIYSGLVRAWEPETTPLLGNRSGGGARNLLAPFWDIPGLSPVEHMMLADAMTYLPDDIMVKVDRANMAVALEGRAPLLDYRVIEYAWRMPIEMKLSPGGSKWPLRHILYKMVPREMIERPKMGFGLPMADWLRGPLKSWAGDLLNPERLGQQGLLDPTIVEKTWNEHTTGRRNWQAKLWNILTLQAWIEETRPVL